MPKDFLLEIHCEEIPAKFLAPLHLDLQEKLIHLLEGKGLLDRGANLRSPDWYSPRKLAVFPGYLGNAVRYSIHRGWTL